MYSIIHSFQSEQDNGPSSSAWQGTVPWALEQKLSARKHVSHDLQHAGGTAGTGNGPKGYQYACPGQWAINASTSKNAAAYACSERSEVASRMRQAG